MSNAHFIKPCPQCQNNSAEVFCDYTSGEARLICEICGYWRDEWIENGEETGSYESKSYLMPYYAGMRDRDYNPQRIRTRECKGFGVACIVYRQGGLGSSYYCIPITQEDIVRFMSNIGSHEVDPTKSYLTRWNDETEEVEFIFGREELVKYFLLENYYWDDEIGVWMSREQPLGDESVTDDLFDNRGEGSSTENDEEA